MFTREQVLEALRGSMGIVSTVAVRLNRCSWATARRYIDMWATTREAYADECERSLDMSESQLLKAVQAGDGRMIRFHLATKGRERGYVQRQEVVQQEETLTVVTRVVRREEPAEADGGDEDTDD